jgi:hypothetical protein
MVFFPHTTTIEVLTNPLSMSSGPFREFRVECSDWLLDAANVLALVSTR